MSRFAFVKWIAILSVLLALTAPIATAGIGNSSGPSAIALAQDAGGDAISETPADAANDSSEPTDQQLPDIEHEPNSVDAPANDPVVIEDEAPDEQVSEEPSASAEVFSSLTLTILDGQTSAPIAGAAIVLRDADSGQLVSNGDSASDGVYIVSELSNGRYLATVSYPGYDIAYDNEILIDGDVNQAVSLTPNLPDETPTEALPAEETETPSVEPTATSTEAVPSEEPVATEMSTPDVVSMDSGSPVATSAGSVNEDAVVEPASVSSVTVTVLNDATGEPLAGATVEIRDYYDYLYILSGITDNTGVVIIDQVPAGKYSISANLGGYFRAIDSEVLISGDSEHTFRLLQALDGSVTVTVLDDATGEPLAGTLVSVAQGGKLGQILATGTTDDTGVFSSVPLPSDTYFISLQRPGYSMTVTTVQVSGDFTKTLRMKSVTAGGVLSITALDSATSQPIAGATVHVIDDNADTVAIGTTDSSGVFTSDQIPAGLYEGAVSHPDYLGENYLLSVYGDSSAIASLVPNTPGAVTVTVLDAKTDSPIPNASITVRSRVSGDTVTTGLTNANGMLVTAQLPAGSYQISASHPDYLDDSRGTSSVTVSGDVHRTARLNPSLPGTLTIKVLDSQTTLPIEGVQIEVLRRGSIEPVASGASGSNGVFLTSQLAAGEYRIITSDPDYYTDSGSGEASAVVNSDSMSTIELLPKTPGVITFSVIDRETLLPIEDAFVTVSNYEMTTVVSGATDSNGVFATSELPADGYNVSVVHPEHFEYSEYGWRPLSGDASRIVKLESRISGELTVTILDKQTGTPLSGATVTIHQNDWEQTVVETGSTDGNGQLTSSLLDGGYYSVEVSHPDYVGDQPYVLVRDDSSSTIRLKPKSVPSPTSSPTSTPTQTNTPESTATASPTPSPTATVTWTPNETATVTPTNPPTQTPTASSTATPTATSKTSPTNTPTKTATASPTHSPTNTPTSTPTASSTRTTTPTLVPGGFGIGDWVRPTTRLNLRTGPGTGYSVVRVLPVDAACLVTGAGVRVGSQLWYPVACGSLGTGFVSDAYLRATTPPASTLTPTPTSTPRPSMTPTRTATLLPGGFGIGDWVRVITRLNLRSGPSTGNSVIAVIASNVRCQVVGSPIIAGGYTWYSVTCAGYGTGSVAGAYLQPAAPPAPTATRTSTGGGIGPGVTVRTTTRLNLRSGPTTASSVIAVLNTNAACRVTGSASSANGYTWYPVSCSGYGTGYVAGNYLRR